MGNGVLWVSKKSGENICASSVVTLCFLWDIPLVLTGYCSQWFPKEDEERRNKYDVQKTSLKRRRDSQ